MMKGRKERRSRGGRKEEGRKKGRKKRTNWKSNPGAI